jgi:hypothetical protein
MVLAEANVFFDFLNGLKRTPIEFDKILMLFSSN